MLQIGIHFVTIVWYTIDVIHIYTVQYVHTMFRCTSEAWFAKTSNPIYTMLLMIPKHKKVTKAINLRVQLT